MESVVISVLPADHALSGCDSTEIRRKKNALKIVESGLAESLLEFGKQYVSDTDFKCRKLSCEVLQPNRKKKDF